MKTFYLIDGHAQVFRAYYAPFPPLTSPDGEPTKVVHVFTQMVLNILRDHRPDYLAVTLDVSDRTTERAALYPEYKANRDRAPEDLAPQVERVVEILRALEVPVFRVEGHEADDLIATIAERLSGDPVEIRIVSRDKDLHQILTDRVKLWDPVKDETIDPTSLEEKLGYTPDRAVEIQTLTGDTTDNVPGVTGIGPKKALQLIGKYGSAEEVLAHADDLTPKMRENVLAFRDQLPLTRKLVTLRRDVPFAFDLESCAAGSLPLESARGIFDRLGLRRLGEELDKLEAGPEGSGPGGASRDGPSVQRAPSRADYRTVDTDEKLEAFVAELRGQKVFAVDTETTSLSAVDCDLVGLSFAWKAGEAWYLPVRSSRGTTLDPERCVEALRPILEDPDVGKIGQNIKYDIVSLRGAGIDLAGVAFDTMVASCLVDPSRRNHSMDSLARDLLGHETIPISDLIGKGKKQRSMLDADPDELSRYAAEDADVTWRLYEVLAPRVEEDERIAALFRDVEMPLVRVLADMEHRGVAIDEERLRSISRRLAEGIEKLAVEIQEVAGHEFNLDSPRQLAEVLFDEQGLRVVKKTKTSRSTDASVLETLAAETAHPMPRLVLEYRELTKLRSTYVEPLPGLRSPRTSRIHASFHQTVTATGRLSSSEPNLQNIPIRTERGREIREAFVAGEEGHVLVTADYSQIELRVLAHLSGDPALREAFESDEDIHAFVAAQIHGVPLGEVTREQRTRAKAVNFGIVYGQGAFGLAQTLGIPRRDAGEFIRQYKERYPGIVAFMEECVSRAEADGSVATMLGRRRPIPEVRSRNRTVRAQGERLAVNTVVQGSAADMIKVAMVRIHRRIREERLPIEILIQVHDELVLEAPRDGVEAWAEVVRTEMTEALPLSVPIRVDVAWGENWLEGKG